MNKATTVRGSRLAVSPLILLAALALPFGAQMAPDNSIASVYLRQQDWPVLVGLVGALVALTMRIPAWRMPDLQLRMRWVVLLALTLAAGLWWGTYALMADYALTRDEHMVLFDMAIFAKGHLVELQAPEWRPFATALVPDFLLNVPGSVGLVSSYLPGNAMMRLGFSRLADPALMNPMLIGVSILALFDIARRLFPGDNRAVLVAVVLYVASAQVLATAMTDYAMTGHTALNLIWLALFLRDRPWCHAIAMAITLWAIGLHQVVFHPLFAAPFLLWRLSQRRYGLFAVYSAVFLAGLTFWMLYAKFALGSVGITLPGGAGDMGYFWRDRILPLLLDRDPGTVLATMLNLMRFVAWQHLALVPLLFAAWPLIRNNTGPAMPLAAGIALTLLFCVVILPFQGHGWGYRYFCGVLGNFAVLGGLGYQRWASRDRDAADGLFVCLSLLTLIAATFLIVRAHQFVGPYARLDRHIAEASTDMVLIDTEPPSRAIDQVRNAADLSNRPLRLSSRALGPDDLRELCQRGSISLVTRADIKRAGFPLDVHQESGAFANKVARALAGQTCLITSPGS